MSQDQPPTQPEPEIQPQSLLKTTSIKLLRSTISVLEKWVETLEAEPGKTPEPRVPVSATGRLLIQVPDWWNRTILGQIRVRLPESLNQKLPDWGLSLAIATILVVLVWTTSLIIPEKSSEVAKVPGNIPSTPAQPEVNATNLPTTTTIPTPPELTAPLPPKPIELAPSPEPILTPEQSLIASIQNQVAEITNQYADGLIKSIKADFQGSLLVVKVANQWYEFSESRQNQLAEEIQQRSKTLDFSKLEITDSEDNLLARNPVVGSQMIVFKRHLAEVKPS